MRKFLGKKGFEDIQTRSAIKIAKNLTVPTIIFYGEKESDLKKRCEETVQLAKQAELIMVKGADHEIHDPEYIKSLQKVL
jgi:predicted alpha/beta-hydrolase family hydrolase